MNLRNFYIICCVFLLSFKDSKIKNPLPEDLKDDNYKTLPDEVLNSVHVCTEIPGNIEPEIVASRGGCMPTASGERSLFWEQSKKELLVAFLDGDTIVQEKVKKVAKEWENYCNKIFVFNDTSKPAKQPDITISFRQSDSWSLIGEDSKTKIPSMNLGWLTPATDDKEYHRVVLHEFGHALGLVHEHQNPNNNSISWNKENVYAYYKKKFNWSKSTTYYNFFEKYRENQMYSSRFDSLSIMMYEIPALFTTNGFHTCANTQLSETDKKFIGMIYPKSN